MIRFAAAAVISFDQPLLEGETGIVDVGKNSSNIRLDVVLVETVNFRGPFVGFRG